MPQEKGTHVIFMISDSIFLHLSSAAAVIQVPQVYFKVSFKLHFFAIVNPDMILTARNKMFENDCWVEAPLCQRQINHSVLRGVQLAFERAVRFGLVSGLTKFYLIPLFQSPN